MSFDFNQHTRQIEGLCRKHRVIRLAAFGSAVSGGFDPSSSDIDLLAVFSSPREPGYADRYLDFAEALEFALGRSVDLLTPGAIRNRRFAETIRREAVTLYEAESHQAA